jgi:hypothetical protein
MKEIILKNGMKALVDDEDYERLSKYKWSAWRRKGQELWYALRSNQNGESRYSRKMEHIILGDIPIGMIVDHKNGDGLDNRKDNLRFATYSQNSANTKKHKNGKLKYKGIFKFRNKYGAKITKNGERIIAGYYSNQFYAALAYDKKARELFGEFARTNFLYS